MALTHVKEYQNGRWVSVTIEEMRLKHSEGGISARSGILMCDLCNKHVIMTSANIRDSYFKHNRADDDKDCPERSIGIGGMGYTKLDKATKGLPIRINVDDKGNHNFELGFPAIVDYIQEDDYIQIIQIGYQNETIAIVQRYFDELHFRTFMRWLEEESSQS